MLPLWDTPKTLLDDPGANTQIKERFLGKIVQNGQKISHMIDRLTLATKFENGDFTTQNTTFDVAKVAAEVAQTFREKYPQRIITTSCLNTLLVRIGTMIEIVISNLIDNALNIRRSGTCLYRR